MHNRFNVTIIIEPSEYLEYEINIKFGSLYENLHQEKLPAVRYKNCYLHRPLIVWLTEYYLDWNWQESTSALQMNWTWISTPPISHQPEYDHSLLYQQADRYNNYYWFFKTTDIAKETLLKDDKNMNYSYWPFIGREHLKNLKYC